MVPSGEQEREPPNPGAAGTTFVRGSLGSPGSNQYPGGRQWQVQPLLPTTCPLWAELLGARGAPGGRGHTRVAVTISEVSGQQPFQLPRATVGRFVGRFVASGLAPAGIAEHAWSSPYGALKTQNRDIFTERAQSDHISHRQGTCLHTRNPPTQRRMHRGTAKAPVSRMGAQPTGAGKRVRHPHQGSGAQRSQRAPTGPEWEV